MTRPLRVWSGRRKRARNWKIVGGRRERDAPETAEPGPPAEPEPELPVWPVFHPAGGLFSLGCGFSVEGLSPAGQE